MKQRLEENIAYTQLGKNPLLSISMLFLVIISIGILVLSHYFLMMQNINQLAKDTTQALHIIQDTRAQWLLEKQKLTANPTLLIAELTETTVDTSETTSEIPQQTKLETTLENNPKAMPQIIPLAIDDTNLAAYSYQIQNLVIKSRNNPDLIVFNVNKTSNASTIIQISNQQAYLLNWSTLPLHNSLKTLLPQTSELRLSTPLDSEGSIKVNQKISFDSNILEFLSYELNRLTKQENQTTKTASIPEINWKLIITTFYKPMLPFTITGILFTLGLLALYLPYWRKKHALKQTMAQNIVETANKQAVKVEHTKLNQALKGLANEFPELAVPRPTRQANKTVTREKQLTTSLLDLAKNANISETLDTTAEYAILNKTSGLPISIPQEVFRAYDVRGDVNLLTPTVMMMIGKALGATFHNQQQREVMIGFDARQTSPSYAKILREALIGSGLSVFDLGLIATPIMHFAAQRYTGNAIIITASHNPASHNGIKWVVNHHSPSEADIQALYTLASQQQFVTGNGLEISKEDVVIADYQTALLDCVSLSYPFKICVDGLHGSMGTLATATLRKAGCDVVALNIEPDGAFPTGNPDPSEKNRLTQLAVSIVQNNAALGFAFDGDGDRVVVLDSKGRVLSPDHLIILLAQAALCNHPGADIVFDVKCSRIVAKAISQAGGRPIMVRSGNPFIRAAVLSAENHAVFGGEFAGHYIFNDERNHSIDDGLYIALRLLEWIEQSGKTLDELLAKLPPRFATGDVYLPKPNTLPNSFFDDLVTDAISIKQASISTIDGFRLDFEDGFAILRASNTSNSFTARLDADSPEALARIRNTFAELIRPYDAKLALQLSTLV